ncbi:MAG: glycosyltransferase family 2 protein [Luteibaculum sp.]
MKIHLITVCYNAAKTIRNTIESVQSQQGCDFLYRVKDGGSSDGTQQLLQEYRVAFKTQADKGLYDALNQALEEVSNDAVLGFIHADDVLANAQVLASIEKAFKENPNIDGLYGDLEYWNADFSKRIRKWRSGKQQSFAWGWMPPHPALYLKKSVFNQVGLFRTDLGSAADYEWMLRAIHIHNIKLHYLPKTLVKMRVGGMSNANLKARKSGFTSDLLAWKVNTGRKNYLAVFLKKMRKIPQFFSPS